MASAKEIKELRSRWTPTVLTEVQELLKVPELNVDAFPFPSVEFDGHRFIDLRGIKPTETILDLTAQYVDFSYGDFALWGVAMANLQVLRRSPAASASGSRAPACSVDAHVHKTNPVVRSKEVMQLRLKLAMLTTQSASTHRDSLE